MKDVAINWAERVLVILLFLSFAVSNAATNDWTNYLLVLTESVGVIFILLRRRAFSISQSSVDLVLALSGTMGPLLIRPGGNAVGGWYSAALIIIGTSLAFGAKISLNRRFGLTPANRGVQSGWAYSMVRHPMYLGYIIAQAGYLIHNPSEYNSVIYAVSWIIQIARIDREERHLLEDEAYRNYANHVRFKLVPGIF